MRTGKSYDGLIVLSREDTQKTKSCSIGTVIPARIPLLYKQHIHILYLWVYYIIMDCRSCTMATDKRDVRIMLVGHAAEHICTLRPTMTMMNGAVSLGVPGTRAHITSRDPAIVQQHQHIDL